MQILVICDTADLVEVPQSVVDNLELYRRRFLKWIYNDSVKHKYWVNDSKGNKYPCYRTDAFIEWLNKKVISAYEEPAVMIAETVDADDYKHLPSACF